MSENVLTLKKDMTYTTGFTGSDTCYVSPKITDGPPLRASMGIPGQSLNIGNWHQDGNVVYFGSLVGISDSNGKILLTSIDTVNYYGSTYVITTVDIKQ
jgi:hypothetical protein